MPQYDYAYQLSDEQLLYYSALPAGAKLRWLDEARRFTLLARGASRTAAGVAETAKEVGQGADDCGS